MHSLFTICILYFLCNCQATPRVLVTIKPIHSLVSGIMQGITEPDLLVSGKSDPHSFYLRKSHYDLIHNADLIISVSKFFEYFLYKHNICHKNLELVKINKLSLIHKVCGSEITIPDPHIWLNVDNTIIICTEINKKLCSIDPKNAAIYNLNTKKLLLKLCLLRHELNSQKDDIAGIYFIALHDAYRYFEKYYNVKNIARGQVKCGHHLSIKSFYAIKKAIKKHNIKFIFVEPQKSNKLELLIKNECKIGMVELDPLGINIAAGKEHYFNLIKSVFYSIKKCH